MSVMYVGERLWPERLTADMEEKKISEKVKIRTYPGLPENMYKSFEAAAAHLPDKTALVDNWGRAYSYGNLHQKIRKFSAWLYQDMQVRKGRHVALMLYNGVEFCVAFLALNKIGAVAVPLPTKYKKEEVRSLTEKSEVDLVICEEKFSGYFEAVGGGEIPVCKIPEGQLGYGLEAFRAETGYDEAAAGAGRDKTGKQAAEPYSVSVPGPQASDEPAASDTALLMFTSGTTSRSKGVVIKNYNIMHAIVSYERTLGIVEEDKAILPVPIYLITGLVAVFGLMMHVGGTVIINRFFDAGRVLEDIKKYKVTFLHASPTVFTLLLGRREEAGPLPGLRMLACGSSNMPPGKIRMLHDWLPDCEFRTIYGLTETTSPATVFPVDACGSQYIGSSGIPIPGLAFRIVDDEGAEVKDGIQGRILVKGSNITEAYYQLQTPALQDGWLDTGDIGYFSPGGYLFIVDRKKDMINRGGEKICSFDVENELCSISGVEDAAVVGIPDELYGEAPAAVVRLRPGSGLTEEKIKEYLREKLAGYMVPVRILALEEIPVTKNMKTDKKKIRQLFAGMGGMNL